MGQGAACPDRESALFPCALGSCQFSERASGVCQRKAPNRCRSRGAARDTDVLQRTNRSLQTAHRAADHCSFRQRRPAQHGLNLDPLSKRTLEELGHPTHQAVDARVLRPKGLPPGECQQALRQRRTPFRLPSRAAQEASETFIILSAIQLEELDIPEVIEVVSDPARKLSYCLHLLLLCQRRTDALQLLLVVRRVSRRVSEAVAVRGNESSNPLSSSAESGAN